MEVRGRGPCEPQGYFQARYATGKRSMLDDWQGEESACLYGKKHDPKRWRWVKDGELLVDDWRGSGAPTVYLSCFTIPENKEEEEDWNLVSMALNMEFPWGREIRTAAKMDTLEDIDINFEGWEGSGVTTDVRYTRL